MHNLLNYTFAYCMHGGATCLMFWLNVIQLYIYKLCMVHGVDQLSIVVFHKDPPKSLECLSPLSSYSCLSSCCILLQSSMLQNTSNKAITLQQECNTRNTSSLHVQNTGRTGTLGTWHILLSTTIYITTTTGRVSSGGRGGEAPPEGEEKEREREYSMLHTISHILCTVLWLENKVMLTNTQQRTPS